MALGLLEVGHRVVAMGRSQKNLDALEAEVSRRGWAEQLACVRGDIRIDEQCRRTIDIATETFGAVDALINNAGFHLEDTTAKFYDLSEDDWRASFRHEHDRRVFDDACGRAADDRARLGPHRQPPDELRDDAASGHESLRPGQSGARSGDRVVGGGTGRHRRYRERNSARRRSRRGTPVGGELPDRSKLVAPAVLVAPIAAFVFGASSEFTGYRIVANRWSPERSVADNLRESAELAAWRGKAG